MRFCEKKSLFLKKSGFVGFDAGLVIYFKKVKKVAGRTKSGRKDQKLQEGPKVAGDHSKLIPDRKP